MVSSSLGGEVWKPFSVGYRFFSIFDKGKTMAKPFQALCYNSHNHCPCARPAHMAESWPQARLKVLQNSGSWMLILRLRVKTLSARDCYWRNSRNYRERSNIKARVSGISETPCDSLCLCSPVQPVLTVTDRVPQELGHWVSSQKLQLPSGIVFGSDCQMTGKG